MALCCVRHSFNFWMRQWNLILIVQVVQGTPAIEFYKNIGFTEPPAGFNYWKVDGFELMGCSAKQFYDSRCIFEISSKYIPSFI